MAKSNPMEEAQEIQQMLVAYAKQETVEPLKSLGKYLGLGIAGSMAIFLGVAFIGMGVLRLSQSETGSTFAGGSFASIVPYLISIGALLVFMAIIFTRFSKAKKRVLS